MLYIKPYIEILQAELVTILAVSGKTGDVIHNGNTQRDTIVNMQGCDEYHEGDDDLEAAKKLYNEHFSVWEWNK